MFAVVMFNLPSSCKSIMADGAFIGITKPLGLHVWDVPPAAVNKLIFSDLCRVSTPWFVVS